MNVGRPISQDAQEAARDLIARKGIIAAAKELGLTKYTVANGAAGVAISTLAASVFEERILTNRDAA
jgi:hypothetical protein